MRKFLRFIDIVIVGLLITILTLSICITDIVLNKQTVKKVVSNAELYEELNTEIKDYVEDELENVFAEYPELNRQFEDIVDSVVDPEILYDQTFDILEQVYAGKEKIEIDTNKLIDGYTANLKDYLKKNNIELPTEIESAIEEVKAENKEGKVEVTENEDVKEALDIFNMSQDIARKAINALVLIIIILMVISIVLSKEKLKVIYKPLIFAGVLVLIIRIVATELLKLITIPDDNEYIIRLYESVKDTILGNLTKASAILLIVGIMLMIVKIIITVSGKGNKKEKSVSINDEE